MRTRSPVLCVSILALGPWACDASGDAPKPDAATPDAATPEKTTKPEPKPKTNSKYRRGQLPPPGMTPEQIKEFAIGVEDPTGGEFTLEQALAGDPQLADPANGQLTATFATTMGTFDCVLYEDQAPVTVANFVGLARGLRPVYSKKEDAWVDKKLYDGVIFHRVIANFMIQTGEAKDIGRTPGYVIPDEFVATLKHDGPGVLSMANSEKPNTGSTQFFITVKATAHLDGKHAVFGKCPDAKVPVEISTVKVDPRAGDRPYENVTIESVTISRKPKGK